MLHIILIILKIIGIILLCLLGLVLTLLLCILFVPIRYRVKGSYYDEAYGKAKVHWLLHILSVNAIYENGELDAYLRIFGIKCFRLNDTKREKAQKEEKKKKDEDFDAFLEKKMEQMMAESTFDAGSEKMPENVPENVPEQVKEKLAEESTEENTWKHKPTENNFDEKQEEKGSIIEKIKCKYHWICDKIKHSYRHMKKATKKGKRYYNLFTSELGKESFRRVKKELLTILKMIKPKKVEIELLFGFENPQYTGEVLGLLYIFYGYVRHFDIQPDFEHKVFRGRGMMRGYIQLYKLALIGLRMYRDAHIKRFIKRFQQI